MGINIFTKVKKFSKLSKKTFQRNFFQLFGKKFIFIIANFYLLNSFHLTHLINRHRIINHKEMIFFFCGAKRKEFDENFVAIGNSLNHKLNQLYRQKI